MNEQFYILWMWTKKYDKLIYLGWNTYKLKHHSVCPKLYRDTKTKIIMRWMSTSNVWTKGQKEYTLAFAVCDTDIA
jgi:hypothetical protein